MLTGKYKSIVDICIPLNSGYYHHISRQNLQSSADDPKTAFIICFQNAFTTIMKSGLRHEILKLCKIKDNDRNICEKAQLLQHRCTFLRII